MQIFFSSRLIFHHHFLRFFDRLEHVRNTLLSSVCADAEHHLVRVVVLVEFVYQRKNSVLFDRANVAPQMLSDYGFCVQISPLGLLAFNCFKQGFEISGTESLMVLSLDYFKEKCRPIGQWLGKNLKQIS